MNSSPTQQEVTGLPGTPFPYWSWRTNIESLVGVVANDRRGVRDKREAEATGSPGVTVMVASFGKLTPLKRGGVDPLPSQLGLLVMPPPTAGASGSPPPLSGDTVVAAAGRWAGWRCPEHR